MYVGPYHQTFIEIETPKRIYHELETSDEPYVPFPVKCISSENTTLVRQTNTMLCGYMKPTNTALPVELKLHSWRHLFWTPAQEPTSNETEDDLHYLLHASAQAEKNGLRPARVW